MVRKIFLFLLTLSLLLPAFAGPAFAQETKETAEKPVILPAATIINHDYFATGNVIDIEGTVNGDVYIAGGTVLINGTVNGDILAGGGQITIKGTARNVRVAGGQVLVEGKLSGNLTALGGNVIIGSGAQVAGSLVGAGGQYTILSPIGKTVNIAAGQVTVGSAIGGDTAILAGGQITLTPTARVNGNLWYQSAIAAQVESGAAVIGKLTHVQPPVVEKKEVRPAQTNAPAGTFLGISLVGALYGLLFAFLVGILFIGLVPVYTQRVVGLITRKPWLSLGVGLVGWVVTPIAIILLALTVIGIPLILVVIFTAIVFTFIGKIMFAIFLGRWICEKLKIKTHQMLSFLLGLVVFEVLGWIPIAGWIFACLATAIGFGAVLLIKKEYYHQLRGKTII